MQTEVHEGGIGNEQALCGSVRISRRDALYENLGLVIEGQAIVLLENQLDVRELSVTLAVRRARGALGHQAGQLRVVWGRDGQLRVVWGCGGGAGDGGGWARAGPAAGREVMRRLWPPSPCRGAAPCRLRLVAGGGGWCCCCGAATHAARSVETCNRGPPS